MNFSLEKTKALKIKAGKQFNKKSYEEA